MANAAILFLTKRRPTPPILIDLVKVLYIMGVVWSVIDIVRGFRDWYLKRTYLIKS